MAKACVGDGVVSRRRKALLPRLKLGIFHLSLASLGLGRAEAHLLFFRG